MIRRNQSAGIFRRSCMFGAAIATLWSISALAEAPKLTTLSPLGIQRGQSTTVTMTGTFKPWPVKLWTDVKGLTWTAGKKEGEWTVAAAADAPLGRAWVRLYNDEGASSLKPFFIGTLPEIAEIEPNDSVAKAQEVAAKVVVDGLLKGGGDVDLFAVKLTRGQTLVAAIDANGPLGSPLDASLQVVSSKGFVLAENDDERGLDPQIVYKVPADDKYIVRVFGFSAEPNANIGYAGGNDYVYRLTLTTGPLVDHAFPLSVSQSAPGAVELFGWNLPDALRKQAVPAGQAGESVRLSHADLANTVEVGLAPTAAVAEVEPNDAEHAQKIVLPTSVTGKIADGKDVDVFQFTAKKGQRLVFRTESRTLGFALDPILRVIDAKGATVGENDDAGGTSDAELAVTIPSDGDFRLVVRDLSRGGGDRFVYRLTAGEPVADFSLALTADVISGPMDKPLEVTVTVARTNGFAEEVDIDVEGLPKGITYDIKEPDPNAPKKDEPKMRRRGRRRARPDGKPLQLAFTAKEPFSGPIRIVGKTDGKEPRTRSATAPIAGFRTDSTMNLWLTVVKPAAPPAKPEEPAKKK